MADRPNQDRRLGLGKVRRPGGREVTKYDPALAFRIIEKVAMGGLVYELTDPKNKDGFPSAVTFYRWLTESPELREAYNGAVELSARFMEEEALRISKSAAYAGTDPTNQRLAAVKLYMEQLRWSASRRNPKQFSEKGSLNVVIPVQINTPLDLGGQGSGVIKEIPNIYTIEAKLEVPDEITQPQGYDDVKELQEKEPRGGWQLKQKRKADMEKRLERLARRKQKEQDDETDEPEGG